MDPVTPGNSRSVRGRRTHCGKCQKISAGALGAQVWGGMRGYPRRLRVRCAVWNGELGGLHG